MPLTPDEELRQRLGEQIADGSSASETLFSDREIESLLEEHGANLERAALEGWKLKAAKLSSLVDNTEGNVQRKFSQLLDNAETMIKIYTRSSSGPTEGRTRIGRAVRPGVEW